MFYHVFPAFVSLVLCLFFIVLKQYLHSFINNLILCLVSTFLFISAYSSTGQFCELEKHMTLATLIIQVQIWLLILLLVIKFIKSLLVKKDVVIIAFSTLLIVLDLKFFWFSFSTYSMFINSN